MLLENEVALLKQRVSGVKRSDPRPACVVKPMASIISRVLNLEKRCEPRRPPRQQHAVLLHDEGQRWAVELSELGFFGGRLQGDLPADLPQRGWRLSHGDLPEQHLIPLRHDEQGLAFVFPHSDAAASQALAERFHPAPQPAAACA